MLEEDSCAKNHVHCLQKLLLTTECLGLRLRDPDVHTVGDFVPDFLPPSVPLQSRNTFISSSYSQRVMGHKTQKHVLAEALTQTLRSPNATENHITVWTSLPTCWTCSQYSCTSFTDQHSTEVGCLVIIVTVALIEISHIVTDVTNTNVSHHLLSSSQV